jgi:very-short-patch-repair endonuclease
VLLSFPSHAGGGRTFLVELRRGGVGYDQAVTPALVVHSLNPDGRVRYEGRAPLTLANDHTDWPCTAGDFALRLVHVDPAHEFVDVMLHAGAQTWFPIRGVLLAGRFRTQRELNAMSNDDMRNTLIVELTKHSHQADYQRFDDDTLAGMGAVMVFLREGHLRDDAALSTMTADDQRNTLIVELDGQTHVGRALQGFDNLDLARIGLGSDLATRGQVPGRVTSWIRGVLLLGGFRTHHELNGMSADDMRNTLIVELTKHSSQNDFQRFNDAELEGMGAVMVAMRRLGIRDDNTLRTMTADDQRNTLIVELDGQTHLGRRLQGLQNIDLVNVTLGVVPA